MNGRTIAVVLAAVLSLFVTARDARAEDAPSTQSRWYGWEYGAADVAGASLIVYARANSAMPLVNSPFVPKSEHATFIEPMGTPEIIGSGLYLGGAPLAHLANGHVANAFASLALRLSPLLYVQIAQPLGGAIGFFVRDSHGQPASCNGGGWVCLDLAAGSHVNDGLRAGADVGLFGGMAAAILVDQVALSDGPIGGPKKTVSRSADLTPDLWVGKDSAYAGVGGKF